MTVDIFPEMMVVVQHGIKVVTIFLSAAGLYGVGKFALKRDGGPVESPPRAATGQAPE